jgi:hypothetical protein
VQADQATAVRVGRLRGRATPLPTSPARGRSGGGVRPPPRQRGGMVGRGVLPKRIPTRSLTLIRDATPRRIALLLLLCACAPQGSKRRCTPPGPSHLLAGRGSSPPPPTSEVDVGACSTASCHGASEVAGCSPPGDHPGRRGLHRQTHLRRRDLAAGHRGVRPAAGQAQPLLQPRRRADHLVPQCAGRPAGPRGAGVRRRLRLPLPLPRDRRPQADRHRRGHRLQAPAGTAAFISPTTTSTAGVPPYQSPTSRTWRPAPPAPNDYGWSFPALFRTPRTGTCS